MELLSLSLGASVVRNIEVSRILSKFQPGDLVLADKGFIIQDIMPSCVVPNIPPFLVDRQFTEEQLKFTTKIARARCDIERSIEHSKIYRILDKITYQYLHKVSVDFQPCATQSAGLCYCFEFISVDSIPSFIIHYCS